MFPNTSAFSHAINFTTILLHVELGKFTIKYITFSWLHMFPSSLDDKYVFTVGHFFFWGGGAMLTSKSVMCGGSFTVIFFTSVCMYVRV
jgi:hypothetical protein